MEPAGCSGCGVCAAVDVHYLSTGGARAAAVLAGDAAFAHVLADFGRESVPSSLPLNQAQAGQNRGGGQAYLAQDSRGLIITARRPA